MTRRIEGAGKRRRVAIVGAGISGLGAADALSEAAEVVVFEAERRLGGHARTVFAGRGRETPVDTGFIVYNERNYPRLTALFAELGVPTKASDMSFSASFDGGRMEYDLRGVSGVFAQRRNAISRRYWGMLADIVRFNRNAAAALGRPDLSLGDLLDELRIGDACRDGYVLPFSGAIWSATPAEMLAFPAETFVRFFQNHGLFSPSGQPLWRTVAGGSRIYVEKLAARIRARGGALRLGAAAEAILHRGGPMVKAAGQAPERFDAVVLACHSDQALELLQDVDAEQAGVLAALRYKANRAVLHDDPSQMPRRRRCWSSWNYRGVRGAEASAIGVTYWMNRLQGLPADQDFFLTLNPTDAIPESHVFDETTFAHPQFDRAAIAAQLRLPRLQGRSGVWLAGAYTRFGFHEDGLASGLDVAASILADTAVEAAA